MSQGFMRGIPLSTDGTFAANSDLLVPAQKAVKTYVDNQIAAVGLTVTTKIADHTLALVDVNSVLVCDTITSLELTIPTNAVIAFPIGTRIAINAIDNGLVSVTHAVGVTLQSVNNFTGIIIDGGWAWLTKIGTDSWNLEGDLRIALDADAEAYIDAVELTGVTFTDAEKGYINDFFLTVKGTTGLYAKFYYIYLRLGGTAAAHKFNAINPVDTDGGHRMVWTGSPTHNANGVVYNGSTQYGDTKFDPFAHMLQDSKNYAFYLITNGTGAVMGSQQGGGIFGGEILTGNWSGSGTMYFSVSRQSTALANPSPNTGVYMMNRDSSTNATLKRNNSTISTEAAASNTNYSGFVYEGGRNFGGAVNAYNACTVAYHHAADGLTSGEETTMYNAIVALNTAFGR